MTKSHQGQAYNHYFLKVSLLVYIHGMCSYDLIVMRIFIFYYVSVTVTEEPTKPSGGTLPILL